MNLIFPLISLAIAITSLVYVIRTTRKTRATWKRVAEMNADTAECWRTRAENWRETAEFRARRGDHG